MTAILALKVDRLRNIAHASLEPSRTLNFVHGANACGKTSVMEAIHLLGHGRSFRDARGRGLVQDGEHSLTVFARVEDEGGIVHSLGMERGRGGVALRVDGEASRSLQRLAECLPLQIIHPESHRLVEQGPQFRRRFLDWGVFHVEPGFYPAWRRFRRSMGQRNALLRASAGTAELEPWERELDEAAERLHRYREAYCEKLGTQVVAAAADLGIAGVTLRYSAGWRRASSLAELLRTNRARDRALGYTQAGPHRADLLLLCEEGRAAERISRGQQKLLVFALVLAQARLLAEERGIRPVLLVDDLAAELDRAFASRVLEQLRQEGRQVWITGTDPAALGADRPPQGAAVFHVERGAFSRVI